GRSPLSERTLGRARVNVTKQRHRWHAVPYPRMLSVPAVPVDERLNPTIASFRVDELHYGPEFWELTYGSYRYLRNASVDELFARHDQIATNFRVLGTAERLG